MKQRAATVDKKGRRAAEQMNGIGVDLKLYCLHCIVY
jgi:hypothetical protein